MNEKFSSETESIKESNILELKNSINEIKKYNWDGWQQTIYSKRKSFRSQGLSFEILVRLIIKEWRMTVGLMKMKLLSVWNEIKLSLFSILIQHSNRNPSQKARERKSTWLEKEVVMLSVCRWHNFTCTQLKEYTKVY